MRCLALAWSVLIFGLLIVKAQGAETSSVEQQEPVSTLKTAAAAESQGSPAALWGTVTRAAGALVAVLPVLLAVALGWWLNQLSSWMRERKEKEKQRSDRLNAAAPIFQELLDNVNRCCLYVELWCQKASTPTSMSNEAWAIHIERFSALSSDFRANNKLFKLKRQLELIDQQADDLPAMVAFAKDKMRSLVFNIAVVAIYLDRLVLDDHGTPAYRKRVKQLCMRAKPICELELLQNMILVVLLKARKPVALADMHRIVGVQPDRLINVMQPLVDKGYIRPTNAQDGTLRHSICERGRQLYLHTNVDISTGVFTSVGFMDYR